MRKSETAIPTPPPHTACTISFQQQLHSTGWLVDEDDASTCLLNLLDKTRL